MRLILALALLPGWAFAQDEVVDCANASTQTALNICAGQAFEMADVELNGAYEQAVKAAREMDSYGGDVPYEELLREAQRAWIAFRDAACEAEAPMQGSTGGSMAPMLHAYCLERLTRVRAEDLRAYAQGIEGS